MLTRYSLAALLVGGMLAVPYAGAKDTEIIQTTSESVPIETRTTTVVPDNPVVLQDSLGGTTIVQPQSSSTVVETQRTDVPVSGKTTIKKKKDSHHLLNLHIPFFGFKLF